MLEGEKKGKNEETRERRMERMEKDKCTLFSVQMIRCTTQLAESIENANKNVHARSKREIDFYTRV